MFPMRRANGLFAGAALVLTVACGSAGNAASIPSPSPSPSPSTEAADTASAAGGCARDGLPTTVAYRRLVGVPRNATSLDVYAPAEACRAPVIVWVHGGGYHYGDKANAMEDKAALFNRRTLRRAARGCGTD